MIKNEFKSSSHQRCMTHLELLGVDGKVKQLVSMYLEMAYQEGEKKNEAKDVEHDKNRMVTLLDQ